MTTGRPPASEISVTLIGPAEMHCHRELVQWLQQLPGVAVEQQRSEPLNEDEAYTSAFVIVLQSYSDQFGADDANKLIERTLGRRLVCCYGPWCVSDGRASDVWPTAVRISVDLFREYFLRELQAVQAGRKPLPPTASGDELFARIHGPSQQVE